MQVAVYWTLKQGYGNHSLMNGIPFVKKTFVKCFWITGSGFPIAQFLKKDNIDKPIQLEVEVYEIPNSTEGNNKLQQIDSLEGHPTRYERIDVIDSDWEIVQVYHQFVDSKIDKTQLIHIEDDKYARKSLSTNGVQWK